MSKKLVVLSGPSGAGLGDVAAAVFAAREDVVPVVPVTARKMKAGEQDGVGFYFYDLEGWNALKESGDLLEATEFAGNDYGTSRRLVKELLDKGLNVMIDRSVDRAAQVKANMPEALCVYIEPSERVLEERYRAICRSSLELSLRMETAERQREASGFCDARICSDDLEAAAKELSSLIG